MGTLVGRKPKVEPLRLASDRSGRDIHSQLSSLDCREEQLLVGQAQPKNLIIAAIF